MQRSCAFRKDSKSSAHGAAVNGLQVVVHVPDEEGTVQVSLYGMAADLLHPAAEGRHFYVLAPYMIVLEALRSLVST